VTGTGAGCAAAPRGAPREGGLLREWVAAALGEQGAGGGVRRSGALGWRLCIVCEEGRRAG
jgi:hypothetical protein